MSKAKADNPTVAKYLAELKSSMKPLLLELRNVVRAAAPKIEEQIKWGNCLTFVAGGKNIIQTVVGKEKITLIFFDGLGLNAPSGILEGEGSRVRSARFTGNGFDAAALRKLVKQAVSLAPA